MGSDVDSVGGSSEFWFLDFFIFSLGVGMRWLVKVLFIGIEFLDDFEE